MGFPSSLDSAPYFSEVSDVFQQFWRFVVHFFTAKPHNEFSAEWKESKPDGFVWVFQLEEFLKCGKAHPL